MKVVTVFEENFGSSARGGGGVGVAGGGAGSSLGRAYTLLVPFSTTGKRAYH